jgi:amino acid adenylation domain-containing protein
MIRTVGDLLRSNPVSESSPALFAPDRESLDYGQLRRQLDQTAAQLASFGIGPGDRVAIVLPNGPEMAAAFLTVAASACAAPLNPAYRQPEYEFFLKDLQARALVMLEGMDSPAREVAQQLSIPILELRPGRAAGQFELLGNGLSAVDQRQAEPDDVALILHTSGTTSRPKMVPLSQANLAASAQHIRSTLALTPEDRCLNIMPLFHIHGLMAAVLASVTAGGSVVCTPNFIAPRFFDWFESFQPTWYTAVPTMHQAILTRADQHLERIADQPLRFIRSSSASLPPEVMAELEAVFGAPVIESYGMTEAAHQMASNPLPPAARKPGSVGLSAGPDVAVMAEEGPDLLANGEIGEIVIRGPNVTSGYLENPTANQAAFTDGWFRTGDQGYLDAEGYLFISGRLKEIINRAGEKISPREVDEVLLSHPSVRQALTFAMPDPLLGEEIAAAVVLAEGVSDPPDLRRFAAQKLADFKVPRKVVVLDEIPKGPTGKLQRIGLAEKLGLDGSPAPEQEPEASAPLSPLETVISEAWLEVLVMDQIGPDTPFLLAGGDSVTAIQLANRIRSRLGVRMTLVDFFDAATVREQARLVEGLLVEQQVRAATPAISDNRDLVPEPARWGEPFALTDIQQAYWVGRQMNLELGGVSTHHYYEIATQELNMARLNRALQQLIDQQGMLRMIVLPDGRQQILPEASYAIREMDLRALDAQQAEVQLLEIRAAMSHQVLPTDRAPILDIRASHLAGGQSVIHLSFDGLALDFESRRRFMREWGQLYQGPDHELPRLNVSFRDYVEALAAQSESPAYVQQRSQRFAELDRLPQAPQLPLALPPEKLTETRFKRLDWHLPAQDWRRLKAQAERRGLTLSGLLLGIYADVLHLWSGQHEMTINLTAFDRRFAHLDLDQVLGDFTTLALAPVTGIAPEQSFAERAMQLTRMVWDILDNPVSGVEVLRERGRRRGNQQAQMPVVFTSALGRDAADEPAPLDWLGEVRLTVSQTPQVWLDLIVEEINGSLHVHWNFVEALFPTGMMASMLAALGRWTEALARQDQAWDLDWPQTAARLMPDDDRQLIARANDTSGPPSTGLLLDKYRRQVLRQPDALALVGPGVRLSYDELDARARALGHELRAAGARPNQLVAIVMEKGWEQIVAVLGVLYAGAAYLPIDAATPAERLAELLADARAAQAVTQVRWQAGIAWPDGIQTFAVADGPPANDLPLDLVNDPKDIAYVIYTSGSTGVPKGVVMDHAGVLTTLDDLQARFELKPDDQAIALTPLTFDLSVFDMFTLLSAGGSLVVPEAEALRDPARVANWLRTEHITVWNTVPTLMGLLLDYLAEQSGPAAGALRLVMLSGDWIPVQMPGRVRELFPQAALFSLGGATEAAIWSILHPIGELAPETHSVPYGTAMQNQQMHVLNDVLEPSPVNVPGELYISGDGLAQGYWGDAEKTDQAFIQHPRRGTRLYRTGDLAAYRPEGWIELLGRVDFQVKIQGFRVELGEIQTVLASHPAVAECVARAFGGRFEQKRLAAYVIAAGMPPSESELHDYLAQRLPSYMLPHRIDVLDSFPLTASGKIDRSALTEPTAAPAPAADPALGDDHYLAQLQAIVQDATGLEQVSPETNLLMAGVNSVDIIRIVNRVEQDFGTRPDINLIYLNPSLLALRDALEASGIAPKSAPPAALIQDPDQRKTFLSKNPGGRTRDAQLRSFALTEPDDIQLAVSARQRRSVRTFDPTPISIAVLGAWLAILRPDTTAEGLSYRYGSASAVYPVQTYLYVKPDRVSGLPAGTYYYDAERHELQALDPQAVLTPDLYRAFVSHPIFESAAFGLFLIAKMDALRPLYGDRAEHYAVIEAGLMTQLLELAAPPRGLGTCQIGDMRFEQVRQHFKLDEDHQLVHSMLGGLPAPGSLETSSADDLQARISQLSEAELDAMLADLDQDAEGGT